MAVCFGTRRARTPDFELKPNIGKSSNDLARGPADIHAPRVEDSDEAPRICSAVQRIRQTLTGGHRVLSDSHDETYRPTLTLQSGKWLAPREPELSDDSLSAGISPLSRRPGCQRCRREARSAAIDERKRGGIVWLVWYL